MDAERGHIISSLLRNYFNELRVLSQWQTAVGHSSSHDEPDSDSRSIGAAQFELSAASLDDCKCDQDDIAPRPKIKKDLLVIAETEHARRLGVQPRLAKVVAHLAGKWYYNLYFTRKLLITLCLTEFESAILFSVYLIPFFYSPVFVVGLHVE